MGTTHNFDSPAAASVGPTDTFPMLVTGGRGSAPTVNQLVSALQPIVSVTAGATALSVTQALHANRTVVLSNTAPIIITLPAATGSGAVYRFYVNVAATGTVSTIKVANATDVMFGVVWAVTTSSDNAISWIAAADSDSIEFNGTTRGGVPGDRYLLMDVATGKWSVQGFTAPTGVYATPFDATVS